MPTTWQQKLLYFEFKKAASPLRMLTTPLSILHGTNTRLLIERTKNTYHGTALTSQITPFTSPIKCQIISFCPHTTEEGSLTAESFCLSYILKSPILHEASGHCNFSVDTSPSPSPSHSTPCGTTGCLCCQLMSKKERVHADNKVFHTPPNTNCNSQGLVYLIECTNCLTRNYYVGQTWRTLKERMAGHRAAHTAKKNMPLYRHLDRHAQPRPLSGVRVTILEIVHPPSEASLLDREARWMDLLNSKIPNGLNSKF